MARKRVSRNATHRTKRHASLKKKRASTRRARDNRVGTRKQHTRYVNAPKAW